MKKGTKRKLVIGAIVFVLALFFPVKVEAYPLWNYWLGGSNKILRYNQPSTKHSLKVAHADSHWNNQSLGTIQRMDNAYNVKLYDYYSSKDGTGGVTDAKQRTIRFNDYYMIRTNHPFSEEVSFMISTHEFGHALGLAHSNGSKNVMSGSFGRGIVNNVPTADDRAGMLASKKR